MNRRAIAFAAAAILALGAVALWLLAREPAEPRPGTAAAPTPPPAEIAQERPPPPVTQEELDRRTGSSALSDQFHSLRTAFEGGRPDARSRERMEAALRRLWPSAPPRWTSPCRTRVCQVTLEEAPAGWQEALRRDAGVSAIADRIAWDPDGPAALAYLLLSPEDAVPGSATLQVVEQRLLASPEVRTCLAAATEAGTVEYELQVDTTGITYLRSGTADVAAQSCVEAHLADIITSTPTPAKVKSESRRVVLHTPR